jgi:hypothetical protein
MVVNNDSIRNNNKVTIIQDYVLLEETFAYLLRDSTHVSSKTLIMLYKNVLLSANNFGHDEMDRLSRATNIIHISPHNGLESECGKPSEIYL